MYESGLMMCSLTQLKESSKRICYLSAGDINVIRWLYDYIVEFLGEASARLFSEYEDEVRMYHRTLNLYIWLQVLMPDYWSWTWILIMYKHADILAFSHLAALQWACSPPHTLSHTRERRNNVQQTSGVTFWRAAKHEGLWATTLWYQQHIVPRGSIALALLESCSVSSHRLLLGRWSVLRINDTARQVVLLCRPRQTLAVVARRMGDLWFELDIWKATRRWIWVYGARHLFMHIWLILTFDWMA